MVDTMKGHSNKYSRVVVDKENSYVQENTLRAKYSANTDGLRWRCMIQLYGKKVNEMYFVGIGALHF